MLTKEEIQRSITELQYQYQSLIREGSYKLAKIRKERVKKLREQLKQLNKTKVQDSMDILRLCGYAADAMAGPGYKIKFGKDPHGNEEVEVKLDSGQIKSFRGTDATREAYKWIKANVTNKDSAIKVGPWMIYQEGNEISVHRGGRAWAQGFKSVQEAKSWIKQKEHWIETGKDEWPTFTKGSKDATTYKPGDRVTIAGGYSARIMSENNGTYIAQLPSGKKIELIANEILSKDDDATEHGSIEQYGKGTKTESMGLSDDPVLAQDAYQESYKNLKIILGNESYKITSPDGRTVLEEGLKTGYSKNDLLAFAKRKVDQLKREMGDIDKVFSTRDSWTSVYEKAFGNQSVSTLESLKSKSDIIRHFQKLGIDPNSADAKEAMRRWFNSDSKPVKDADPKVAEAQAIINLCGGIF